MKVQFLKPAAWVMGAALILSGCDREASLSSTTTASDLSSMNSSFDDAEDEAALRLSEDGGTCPLVSYENEAGTYPNVITLDWGDSGCVDERGHEKTGKLVISISDDLMNEGAVKVITPDGFAIDGHELTGVRTISNLGLDESGRTQFSVLTEGAQMRGRHGKEVSMTIDHLVTLIAGEDTEDKADDEFLVEGSEYGTDSEGRSFSAEIVEAIHRARACEWPLSGVRVMSCERGERSMDFGDGECDDQATVTMPNGEEKVITLHRGGPGA